MVGSVGMAPVGTRALHVTPLIGGCNVTQRLAPADSAQRYSVTLRFNVTLCNAVTPMGEKR